MAIECCKTAEAFILDAIPTHAACNIDVILTSLFRQKRSLVVFNPGNLRFLYLLTKRQTGLLSHFLEFALI